jgi:hypothetical protein
MLSSIGPLILFENLSAEDVENSQIFQRKRKEKEMKKGKLITMVV